MPSYILTAIDFSVTLRLAVTVGYSVQGSAGPACMCNTFFFFLHWANFALSHHYDYCCSLNHPSSRPLYVLQLKSAILSTRTHTHIYIHCILQFPFNPSTRLELSQTITHRRRRIWLWASPTSLLRPSQTEKQRPKIQRRVISVITRE